MTGPDNRPATVTSIPYDASHVGKMSVITGEVFVNILFFQNSGRFQTLFPEKSKFCHYDQVYRQENF